jgi:hypothetical protein
MVDMSNFPFVLSFSLTPVEYVEAETLLADYNDFYVYNLAQHQSILKGKVAENGELEETGGEGADSENHGVLEKIAADNVSEFVRQWGSRDFASATLMGLSIEWEKLQEILFDEQEKNVKIADSVLKPAAEKIRNLASVLSFAERILYRLRSKKADNAAIETIKQGFENLIDRLAVKEMEIPEFHKEYKNFNKANTKEKVIEYAKALFNWQ